MVWTKLEMLASAMERSARATTTISPWPSSGVKRSSTAQLSMWASSISFSLNRVSSRSSTTMPSSR